MVDFRKTKTMASSCVDSGPPLGGESAGCDLNSMCLEDFKLWSADALVGFLQLRKRSIKGSKEELAARSVTKIHIFVSTGSIRWIPWFSVRYAAAAARREIFSVNALRGKQQQLGSPNLQDIFIGG